MTTNVLLYERPYTKVFFRKVAIGAFNNCKLITMSEYKNCSDIWLSRYLYSDAYDHAPYCDALTVNDIIMRCRTLRIMDSTRAQRIVHRTWSGIFELFQNFHIDYVLAMSLDNYVGDILFRIANLLGKPVYSFLGSFASGYVRFTLRGEKNCLNRGVTIEEAQKLLTEIQKSYYLPPSEQESSHRSKFAMRKWFLRRKAIENIYYPLMKMITNDPDNARFNMLNLKGIKYSECLSSEIDHLLKRLSDIKINRKCAVYFPLHFCPEATTDYYLDRPTRCGGYINYILDILEHSDPQVQFIFKEHPSMYGQRPVKEYYKILEFPNATILHPQVRSNELMDSIDTVVVDNGTVGVEALIRGKRVLALDRNYYTDLHPNCHKVNYIKLSMLDIKLIQYDSLKFVSELLDEWVKSDYEHSSDQSHYDPKPIIDAIKRMIREDIRLG